MLLKRLLGFFLETLQVVIFAVSIFLFIYLLVLQPHKIKGDSMLPNFFNNEYLLTDKLSYRFGEPKRGDVIVFKAPPDFKDEFIKRIIGLPGDRVMVREGHVFVNGREVREQYLREGALTYPGRFTQESREITVEPNTYFVLGDNREHSLDSRTFGFVEKDKITGRAWFIYWPIGKVGTVSGPSYL